MVDAAVSRKVGRGQGRKPVTANHAAQRYVSPQDAIWCAVRQLKMFDRAALCSQLIKNGMAGGNDTTIISYLQRLTRGGFIRTEKITVHTGCADKALRYTLVRDVGTETPRLRRNGEPTLQGRGTDNLWRSMKVLKVFTYIELLATATTETVAIKPSSAKAYLQRLHQAGYLVVAQAGGPNKPARYQLLPAMITGPRAPMVQRTHRVFDPNLKKIMWSEAE